MSGFSVYKRGKFYYARLKNPTTGKWSTAKSTGKQNRDEAVFIAMGWLHGTIPMGRARKERSITDFFTIDSFLNDLRKAPLVNDDIPKIINILKDRGFIDDARLISETRERFVDFLCHFWDFDTSPYVLDRQAHGKSITKAHSDNNARAAKNYWEPFFKDKLLVDVTRKDLKEFSIWLSEQKTVKRISGETIILEKIISPSTRNNILKAGTVALRWAHLEKMINENPADGISFFSGKSKKRGILTKQEAQVLFTEGQWGLNPANKLANYTAMQTGLRMGELCALRVKNILPDRIVVNKSWSPTDGLKSTKTQEDREVAIRQELSEALLKHARTTPHKFTEDSFVFYNVKDESKPHDGKLMYRTLKKALDSIEVNRTERNINFHSWRHFFARQMVDVLDQRAADLTGHASPEMLAHYADHSTTEDFEKAKKAVNEVFGNIIPFSMEEAV